MLSRHPFHLTSVMLLLIIIHANQKNFTVIILQAVQIIFSLDLFDCLFCGMSPLQFDNQSRQIAVSIRLKYNICEPFSSWHFSVQGIVFLSGVICQGNHTGQSIFIVVFQNRCVCLMCLFNQFCNLFAHHRKVWLAATVPKNELPVQLAPIRRLQWN